MVRRWSYLDIFNSNPIHNFSRLLRRHTFKVFKSGIKFRKFKLGVTQTVRVKRTRKLRKTTYLNWLGAFRNWFRIYYRTKQYVRYYQTLGIFSKEFLSFSAPSLLFFFKKHNFTGGALFYTCSNNIALHYTNLRISENIKFLRPIKNTLGSHALFFDLKPDEDTYSSDTVRFSKNYFINETIPTDLLTCNYKIEDPLLKILLLKSKSFYKIITDLTLYCCFLKI